MRFQRINYMEKLPHCFWFHRSANLIVNLFSLMVDANVPDIALEPDKTVKKVKENLLIIAPDSYTVTLHHRQ